MEPDSMEQPARKPALAGIRIADFSWVFAGPISTKYLALMGAEVIKIESRRRPDVFRLYGGLVDSDGQPLLNRGRNFNAVNHSKLSCTLDLSKPEALAIAKALVKISDAVVENFAFGVMERLGLGYSALKDINPSIVMLSSSGLGRTGPERDVVAYGNNLHAYSGIHTLTGYEGDTPEGMRPMWTDPLTGITAAYALLAALHYRRRTGHGQYIDLSMAEATVMQLPEAVLDYTMNGRVQGARGNRDDILAPHNCYPCDGHDKWIAIAVETEEQWRALCATIGQPDLANDERYSDAYRRWSNQSQLDTTIAEWTRRYGPREATELLQAAGIPAGPSLNARELIEDPHMRERGFYAGVDHPEVGRKLGYTLQWKLQPGPPPKFTRSPLIGEHTDYVLRDLLGIAPDEARQLKEEKVVF